MKIVSLNRKGLVLATLVASFVVNACNRDGTTQTSEQSAAQTPVPPVTPHPAKESIAQALRLYPALQQKDSAMNQKFVALFNEAKATNPNALAKPDWPTVLAARASAALSSAPVIASSPRNFSPSEVRAMEQAATEIYGRVVRSASDGCVLHVNGFSGGAWIARGAARAGVAVTPLTIFLEGSFSYGDGEQFQDLKIFPTGQYVQRGSSRMRLYTTSATGALQHIQEAGAGLSTVVTADHSMWTQQQSGADTPSSGYSGGNGDSPMSGRGRLGL